MATSGSTNHTITAGDIINNAFRILNVTTPGQAISTELLNEGMSFLNLLVKSWGADGLQLWSITSASLAMVLNTSSYTLGATGTIVMERPLRILSARRKDSSDNEVPVTMISQDEYNNLTPKTTDGKITQVYYDPQLTNGVLYVWPQADDITDTLEITYQRTFEDFDDTSNTPDFPQEWYLALVYGLASILGDAYPVDPKVVTRVNHKAYSLKEQVLNWSVEDDSIFLTPDMMHGN